MEIPIYGKLYYADFWVRFLAFWIDYIVFTLIGVIAGAIGGAFLGREVMRDAPLASFIFIGILATLGNIVYLIERITFWGQTYGKKLLKIRIIDNSGYIPTFGKVFLREVIGKFVSTIILFMGFILICFDQKNRGLHDRIASTFVIKTGSLSRVRIFLAVLLALVGFSLFILQFILGLVRGINLFSN